VLDTQELNTFHSSEHPEKIDHHSWTLTRFQFTNDLEFVESIPCNEPIEILNSFLGHILIVTLVKSFKASVSQECDPEPIAINEKN
jgi:hypothetical protein